MELVQEKAILRIQVERKLIKFIITWELVCDYKLQPECSGNAFAKSEFFYNKKFPSHKNFPVNNYILCFQFPLPKKKKF